jgi:FkbM family methyltransferase
MLLDLGNLQRKYNCNINGVLHIGAHGGGEYGTYKSLSIEPIIFVEPQPNIFKQLKENVGDGAICLNMALGNTIGEIEMFTNDDDQNGSSSILEPKLHVEQYPHIKFTKKIKVSIDTIDNIDIPKCNFINIDVQGYELEVLKGGKEYLNNVDYIMTEVNNAELYEGCALVQDLDEYLIPYGFERVETSWDGVTWGDAFYIKKK